jgi:hypothetical protein
MIEMTTKQLWTALTPAEKEDACLALWEGTDTFSRDAQPKVLKELATALRFREMFLKRLKPVERARHLRRLLDTPTLRHLCDDVFRSWMVARKTPMLIAFVEAQGMAHSEGIVDDTAKAPSVETLQKGVRAVRDQFPPRDVALYMGVMLVAGGDFWAGLPEAVEAEIPGFMESLGL